MALLQWDESYSVGIAAMDSQHTAVFAMINDLHAAMLGNQMRGVTAELLHRMQSYTDQHFAAEEVLLVANEFPDREKHIALHRELSAKVSEFIARFESGEAALSLHLLNFLRDWWASHILFEDHNYGTYLNEHGLH